MKTWSSRPTEIALIADSLNGLDVPALSLKRNVRVSLLLLTFCAVLFSSVSPFQPAHLLSGGDDTSRSGGVFYRAAGERRRHDRRRGRRARATSHRLPLLWHQEAACQSARRLSPQRSDPLNLPLHDITMACMLMAREWFNRLVEFLLWISVCLLKISLSSCSLCILTNKYPARGLKRRVKRIKL